MNDDRESPLLLAVEDLTKPMRSKVLQDKTEPPYRIGHTMVLEDVLQLPLLAQLDSAIRSSMGGSSAGASLASEGAPLNTAALHAAMKISSQIRDWCHAVQIRPVKDTAKDLTAWFNAFSRSAPELEVERYRVRVLHGWAAQIRSMLNPARERDLPDVCPACGADSWYDPKDGQKYPRPLIIRYRPGEENMLDDAKGTCRACAAVWGVRELAYAIEEQAG